MVAYNSRKISDKWRSFALPACPLPPEQQRYFHTLSRLYVIATATYVLALLPMFWLLGSERMVAITLIGLSSVLAARELHRRGYMTAGVSLVLTSMAWHMLESISAYGAGVGFELYFPVILLIIYISAMPPLVKLGISLLILALTALQVIDIGERASDWRHESLIPDIVLMANMLLVCVLFAVVLTGLEGVTERLERSYRREATHDALTGVYNRRAVFRAAEQMAQGQQTYAMLMIDIDYFKRINDEYGHDVGDRALCHLTECLRLGLREEDVLGRYGGEEFMVVLNGMTLNDAVGVAERLAALVRENPYAVAGKSLPMSVSVGVAVSSQASDLNGLVALADQRLYRAKRTGRDRIVARDRRVTVPAKEDPLPTPQRLSRFG
ncbi:GGDEF domain-containing protein [Halomonas sp. McH1-25]|uniref:GGDEF domain-containing protein n=1 Tax=unclassified Halomonas TaxID=2609666 RepID=UPI001EF41215|nr:MULTISPECIES: GGDEF domain-containing protein [unclassified Halomonas]MCG7601197.1 GGDEF domain-containing protein [Halomonas sp. McH1-25]MCP1341887.1 GGDEF domain-containing protein [Halomonas sp. FL8]MCP1360152.1 GGDEF domain-containing protein [Halomonas sp. BBD45]MCP1364450.1 GGDEF domain-containing protein [Halomonas sp. BBD48]